MNNKERILGIIPAYNEEENIKQVLLECKEVKELLKHKYVFETLVVDDGSTDRTAEIAKQYADHVIIHEKNQGLGKTMYDGFVFFSKNNFHYCIQIDGDGQHDPAEIIKLLYMLKRKKPDVVLGSRFVNLLNSSYAMPMVRRIGILFFSIITGLLYLTRLTDVTSGFRLLNKRAVKIFLHYYENDFPDASAIIRLLKRGLTIVEVPVKMRPRKAGVSSLSPKRMMIYPLISLRHMLYSILT